MKRILPLLMAMLLLCGCAAAAPETETTAAATTAPIFTDPPETVAPGEVIGICLPDQRVQRWVDEAAAMESILREWGYEAEVLYAGGSTREQARQVEELVEQGVSCLIIAAIDSTELVAAEELAHTADIPVIAYDRLLMDTEAVDAYVGMNYLQIGRDMGTYILENKKLAEKKDDGFTVEFLMGSPEDHNALLLYQGLTEVLQPYLESGALVCRTGRTAFEDCCITGWDGETAKAKFSRYLEEYYPENAPDLVIAATDEMAAGCLQALAELEKQPETMPLVIGCGGELAEGQSVTFRLDTSVLARPAVALAHQLIVGQEPSVTAAEGYQNHAVAVPAWLEIAEMITK